VGVLLLLFLLKRTVKVWNHTSLRDRCVDNFAELLIPANSEEKVAGLQAAGVGVQLLSSVACELEELSSQVLQESGAVNGSGATTALLAEKAVLETHVNATDWKVKASTGAARGVSRLSCLATRLAAERLLPFTLTLTFSLALGAALAFAVRASRDDARLVGGVSRKGWGVDVAGGGHVLFEERSS
jgi:hypothetical protein